MRPALRLVLAALAAAALSDPIAATEVVWLSTPFPPVNILEGPLAGQGLNDGIRTWLQRELTQFEHRDTEGNLARLLALAREGQTVCSVNLLRTPERERDLVYSEPATVSLTLHLILRVETWRAMGEPASLSVAEIATRTDLSGAVELGRPYSADIDTVLDSSRSTRRMTVQGSQIFRMLVQNRLDWTVEYPFVVEYLARDVEDPWVAIPISEAPPFVVGHIACARTEDGGRVIARVDEVLRDIRLDPAYSDIITRWHPPEQASRVLMHYRKTLTERGLLAPDR